MFSLILWILAALLLIISWSKNKDNTTNSLKLAFKFFRSMTLLILITIWIIGFLLAFLPSEILSKTVGQEAGFNGIILAALFGSIVLIQAFIAFPLAGSLLLQGANISAIAAFVTTLVMVGVATIPLEIKLLGRKFAFWRNALSFVFALIIASIMGAFLK